MPYSVDIWVARCSGIWCFPTAILPCRVLKAAQDAISSSLLEVSIDSATGVLFNVTGPMDLGLAEVRWGGCLLGCVRNLESLGRL